ncbi:hypothetical protein ACFLQK_00845 [bacterium]
MSDLERNRPAKRNPAPGAGGREGEPINIHFQAQGPRVVGPLIGCPLMIFMIFFVLLLTIIAFILSLFGGRRAAELIMRRVAQMRDSSGSSRMGGGDPDVIDVDGTVVDPPKQDRD